MAAINLYVVHNCFPKHIIMPKIFLQACLLLISAIAYSQGSTDTLAGFNKKYTISQLKEDLSVLKDSLEIIHPALYRYHKKKDFDAAFTLAGQQVNRPLTQAEFYGILAPVIGMVGDIHTTIELPDESFNYLATKTELFPFDVRIVNKNIYIASNNSSDTSIPVGSRIIKINEQPADELLHKLGSSFSDEGTNETLQLKKVEQRFAFQYYLCYGYSKDFKLEYSTGDGPSQIKNISAQPFSVIKESRVRNQAAFPKLKPLFPQPPYLTLSIDKEKNIAILTIKWFQNDVLESNNEKFKPFIDDAFNKMRSENIGNLIIDIRNNGGGESENAGYLYSYIANKPFRFLYAMEVNKKIYEDDIKRGIKYMPVKSAGKYQTSDSTTGNAQFYGFNLQQPRPGNFSGNVYLLIDGLTTSAAPQFASLVRLYQRGLLIGEPAPGSLYGGSGRGYSYFYLPNSGLLTMISQYRLYMASPGNKNKDTFIIPDYRLKRSLSDVLNGIDRELEFAIKLITGTK